MSADGTNIHLWYNGVYKGYVTPATTELRVSRYGLGYATTSLGFEGILADAGGWDTYTSDGTVVIGDARFYHKLDDITGTTVPDSSDSGNNGVASGLLSPRIPAQAAAPTLDVYGDLLTNPSVAPRPNDSESTEDCKNITEGGTPTAATNSYPSDMEALEFSDTRTDMKDTFVPNNTFFRQDYRATEKRKLFTFDAPLTGSDLALLEKHTE
tara:strand:- start:1381 stop:2013 length:633 start_codon:yes stop_codon:yes gene_type:complete